jgi:hypothetical protein
LEAPAVPVSTGVSFAFSDGVLDMIAEIETEL